MSKAFVFCIGGTGLRVMKSAIMLMAAGMKTNGYEICPIVIDPHEQLEEKKKLDLLINDYIDVYNKVVGKTEVDKDQHNPLDGFFCTSIKRYYEYDGKQNDTSSSLADNRTLRDFLDVGCIPANDINSFLVQSILSESNLNNPLSVGFKGNPNVGTIVLGNLIEGQDWWEAFQRLFKDGDRVFIISSIFGGTGASGFPLMLNKIRDCEGHPMVKKAFVGAVTVFPYFSLEDPSTSRSDIDSANFITKTKAALAYYEKNVNPDYLYYVGDISHQAAYDNNETEQKDYAHFIEMVAATALFDFLKNRTKQTRPQYMSRAIEKDKEVLDLESLGNGYKEEVRLIANIKLLNLLMEVLKDERFFPLKKTHGFNKKFYNGDFKALDKFMGKFNEWYEEISNNTRGFSPLAIPKSTSGDLSRFIKGFSLNANRDHELLLDMIEASKKTHESHHNVLRYFLDFSYKAINDQTEKL